jgi:hypothetical protein
MAKSLSERTAERVKVRKAPGRGGKNRADFLAHRDDIAKGLADGWSARALWETLKEEAKIDFSYDAFTKYVNQLIKQPQSPTSPVAASSAASTNQPALPAPASPHTAAGNSSTTHAADSVDRRHERRPQEAGFRIKPTKKEDLV